ncbi:MAG TPA: Fe-S cluster assembly protein SufD [Solirubrobacterales bacterium]|nr:Fe-S cluster assembly protein SufD [Solirubrobacterales bacterium]HMX72358.1 Fe-S cluster assembly protein SufD [Solirubrobacterales bacterium]HMY26882.1 Fe-S cluster assembly protein SufD [Solirubrobacterales bacterium]HNA24765.1 Fe-S cluster assembly protein SufD [Solirubrobacterales bacterium]HNA44924.1 Fe-S cluster assembly protein SufD [Solirubrobacterales bacterium]
MASAELAVDAPAWLVERREKGAALVETIELPHAKTKGWEFTDISRLDLDSYENSPAEVTISGGSDEIIVLPLSEALASHSDLLAEKLGSLVSIEDPFVARNEATLNDGVLVYVPKNVECEEAIKVDLKLDTDGAAVNWRTLVVLEEGAKAEVWEHYGSASDETDALLNTVVELVVGQAANLHFVATQDLSEKAWLFSTQRGEVQRDGSLDWATLGFGGGGGKVRMTTNLAGPGSDAKVTGGYAGGNSQHIDYDTLQEHAAEHTTSDLAFRGVLADKSSAVWRGMIKVDEGAQQTDAFQECRNMLLSTDAHADAIPGLEILADDVACTHAAAIAQVDKDQLFYLESRGLSEETSRSLVVEGFLQSLVERLGEGPVRDEIAERLETRLAEIL